MLTGRSGFQQLQEGVFRMLGNDLEGNQEPYEKQAAHRFEWPDSRLVNQIYGFQDFFLIIVQINQCYRPF